MESYLGDANGDLTVNSIIVGNFAFDNNESPFGEHTNNSPNQIGDLDAIFRSIRIRDGIHFVTDNYERDFSSINKNCLKPALFSEHPLCLECDQTKGYQVKRFNDQSLEGNFVEQCDSSATLKSKTDFGYHSPQTTDASFWRPLNANWWRESDPSYVCNVCHTSCKNGCTGGTADDCNTNSLKFGI